MRQIRQAPGRHLRAVGVVSILFCLAIPVSAQTPTVAYDGAEIFCHILKHFKFEPIKSIEDLPEYSAAETVIIVFGDLSILDQLEKIWTHRDDYGFLLASDRRTVRFPSLPLPEDFFDRFLTKEQKQSTGTWRLCITGAKVTQDQASAYQGKSRCPLIKNGSTEHPLMSNISQGIATNCPSYIENYRWDLVRLAGFANAQADDGRFFRRRSNGDYMFCTKPDDQRQQLILAGHGVFMNGMIAQSDNDNGMFAINTIRWLRDGPQGKRKYALMIHDGKVIESFDLPLTAAPQIPMPPVHVINRMLRELENEGIVHRFFEDVVGWRLATQIALLALTLGLLAYGVARLFALRHRQENVPLLVGIQPPPARGRSVIEQRQYELLTNDNLWEPAQALARQWFLDNARVDAPLWDEAERTPPPAARYGVSWWARQKLAQHVAAVWSYALRDPAARVSLAEFRKLTATLQALDRAVRDGRIEFPHGRPSAES